MVYSLLSYTLISSLLFTYHFHTSFSSHVELVKLGWDAVTTLYSKYDKNPPVPLLVFYDPIAKFNHMQPVIWSEDIDSNKMSVTPLEELYSAVPEVLASYSKKDEIEPSKCVLFYEFGSGRVTINSDKVIVDMLTLEPDFDGRRRVFVDCPGVELDKCASEQCKADTGTGYVNNDDEYDRNNKQKQYHLAMNAYRHAKGHQIKRDEGKLEQYEEDLEDMELAGFVVTSEALQMVQQDIGAYMEQLEERGKAFGWDAKMMISAKDGATAKTAQFAEKEVEFDQKNWKLKGRWRRLATYLSEDGKKISYAVATSKFECDIPEKEREQSLIGKWITNAGTVKNKFKKRILYVMQADGQQASNENLMLPQPYQF
eukprot:365886_1